MTEPNPPRSSPDRDVVIITPVDEHVDSIELMYYNARNSAFPGYGIRGEDEARHRVANASFTRMMSFIALAFLWTGSQIPIYLFGAIPPYIYEDLGGADRWVWYVLGYLLALASVCPFVGSLSDILGRRYVAMIGAAFIFIGMAVCSTARTMNIFICGMVLAGAGAGINELTALAGTSELAPTAKRGKYIAILIFTILPYCPAVLWAQLLAFYANWRYCGVVCGVWAAIGFLLTLNFYHPPPRVNSEGLSHREIISRIDVVGGFLSISGMVLFMAGLQWGGYQYEWTSAHVLVPLLVGSTLLVAFYFWEVRFAKFPMFPARLKQAPWILIPTLIVTFVSGANFFSILMFWPTQAYNVYGHDPVSVGLRGLPIGFSILTGGITVLWLLSVFRGGNRALMLVSSTIMTAGVAALACATTSNLNQLWGILVLAGLGIGGIVIPSTLLAILACPDDLIATVAALSLAVRVCGGTVGYCVYYNVFVGEFVPAVQANIGRVMDYDLGIVDPRAITAAIKLTAASLLPALRTIPGIAGNETAYQLVVLAGQQAFADAYRYVYYASLAFGSVSIIAALFMKDIRLYMDDHVAVVMH